MCDILDIAWKHKLLSVLKQMHKNITKMQRLPKSIGNDWEAFERGESRLLSE